MDGDYSQFEIISIDANPVSNFTMTIQNNSYFNNCTLLMLTHLLNFLKLIEIFQLAKIYTHRVTILINFQRATPERGINKAYCGFYVMESDHKQPICTGKTFSCAQNDQMIQITIILEF